MTWYDVATLLAIHHNHLERAPWLVKDSSVSVPNPSGTSRMHQSQHKRDTITTMMRPWAPQPELLRQRQTLTDKCYHCISSTLHAVGTRYWFRFPLQLVSPQWRRDSLAGHHSDTRWNRHEIILSATQTLWNNDHREQCMRFINLPLGSFMGYNCFKCWLSE